MRLRFIIAVMTFTVALHAEDFQVLLGTEKNERGVFVSETADGGFVVVGEAESKRGDEDVLLARFDRSGKELWQRRYGGSEADYGWAVYESGNGFVVAGSTKSEGAGGYDCLVMETDRNGVETWTRTYGGENDDRCWGMQPLENGGWVLVGETSRAGKGTEDCFLLAIDSDGTEIFSRSYGGDKSDRCFAVALTGNGFILAGQTYSEGAGDRDVWVIRTDGEGNELWSRTWGGEESDVGHSIVPTADDAFLVTGYTASMVDEGEASFLVKVDADGEEIWTRVIELDGVVRTITGDETSDGGFCLTGFVQGNRGVAALLVRTDAAADVQWTRRILETTGESFGYTVRGTSDGGCIFTGHSTQDSQGGRDLLLVKIGATP